MTKAPTPTEMSKGESYNTNTSTKDKMSQTSALYLIRDASVILIVGFHL